MNINFKTYLLKVSIIAMMLLTFVIKGYSQDPIAKFNIATKEVSGRKMSDVKIVVTRGGKEVFNETTGGNGRVSSYEAYYGYNYEVKFIKDGFVSKVIAIDMKDNFYEEDVDQEIVIPFDMVMLKKEAGIDYSIIENKPVGKFRIDKNTGFLDLDGVFTSGRKQEIDKFFKKIEEDAKNKEKRFKDLVKAGDKANKKEKYKEAIESWKAALDIKDDDDLRVKIADAGMFLDNKKEEEELNKKFNDLIKEGDQLVASEKYDEAINKYNAAQNVKPKERLPKEKIKEATEARLNAEKNKTQKAFDDLMAKADKEIDGQKYQEALVTLAEAKTVKPTDKSASSKIKEINDLLAKRAKNKANFDKLVAEGAGLFASKNYESAKTKYQEALDLIPGEKVPTDKIKEIDKLIAEQNKANKAAADLQKQFDSYIKEGEKALSNKDYDQAKKQFQEASKVLPNEQLPKDRLIQIQNELKLLNESYTNKIKEADNLLDNKQFDESIAAYKQALSIKKDSYPTAQILKAEKLKASSLADLKNAKKQKEAFDKLIKEGDKLLRDKSYQQAIDKYSEANKLMPTELLAKTKLNEANEALKQVNKQYQTIIAKADGELESGSFKDAIASYNEALTIKKEQYPVDQIAKAKGLLLAKQKEALNAEELENQFLRVKKEADNEISNQNFNKAKEKYEEALSIKPDAEDVKKQIKLIDDIIAKRKAQYDGFINKADNDFKGEDYLKAIANYEEALLVSPIEQYPKDQIALARKKLEELKDSKLLEADKNKKYEELIAKANLSFNTNKFVKAKEEYTKASVLKANEQYPKDQLVIIEAKLKELAEKEAKEKALAGKDEAYRKIVNKADLLFANKKYEEAKTVYKKAWGIKNDAYVQSQIDKSNQMLKQLSQEKDLKKQYDKIVKVADQKFAAKDYDKAISLYKRAISFNPSDKYPPLKIAEIEKIKASLLEDERLAKEIAARNELRYTKLINKGNANMKSTRFELAKSYFEDAIKLKPNEIYPQQKLKEIEKILNEQKAEREKLQAQGGNYLKLDADLYGEEVDMKEGDVNLIISKTKDDQEYRKYLKLRDYIDSVQYDGSKDNKQNITKTYLSFEDYDKMKELIAKQQKGSDAGRRGNVDQYKVMKNYFATENGKKYLKAYEQNGEIAELITNFKDNIREIGVKGQLSIEPNAEYYNKLKDDYAKEAAIDQKENINKTSEIAGSLTQMKDNISKNQNDGQEKIEQNNSKYVRLNEQYSREAKAITEKNINKTGEIASLIKDFEESISEEEQSNQLAIEKNATYYNDLNDKYAKEQEEKTIAMDEWQGELDKEINELKETLAAEMGSNQLAIEKNSDLYNLYTDTRNNEAVLVVEKFTNKTSEIAQQTEDLKEQIGKENNTNQLAIEKNAKDFENYTDKLSKLAEAENKKNINKTSEIFNETTSFKDQISENQNDGQLSIEKNAKEYQAYNDKYSAEKTQEAKSQSRKGQEIANQIEEQKEDIARANKASTLENEKKSIKYDLQKDRLAQEGGMKSEDNERNTYNTSSSYTYTKDNLDKKQSDGVASQLALIFPEGVTQKIYQRKNDKGEVTEITVRRIVVEGNKGNEYLKTTTKSGTYYFKNGQPISDSTWDIETSGEIISE